MVRIHVMAVAVVAVALAACQPEVVGTSVDPNAPAVFAAPTAALDGDMAYGEDGLALYAIGEAGGEVQVGDAVALPDGGAVVAGRAELTGDRTLGFLLRLTADGQPDPGFGTGGIATVGTWAPQRVALHPDGSVTTAGGDGDRAAAVRFATDGSQDGEVVHVAPPVPDGTVAVGVPVTDAVVDGEGRLLLAAVLQVNEEGDVGGCCAIEPDSIPFTARLTVDGTLDESYGVDGLDVGVRHPTGWAEVGPLPGSPARERHRSDEDLPGVDTRMQPRLSIGLSDGWTLTVGVVAVERSDGGWDRYLAAHRHPATDAA